MCHVEKHMANMVGGISYYGIPQYKLHCTEWQFHGEVTPCQIKNHVQRKFATPILYAIDIFKNYDFFSLHT
jgi:hypothetical protein